MRAGSKKRDIPKTPRKWSSWYLRTWPDSMEEAEEVAAPALGRFLGTMLGVDPPDVMELYAQMVERGTGLFGTAEHIARLVERYAGIGVDHIAFNSKFGGITAGAAERSLRSLAPGS